MWMDGLGEDYVDIACHRAREVDPSPMRFLTDFGIEHDSPRCERRRTAMLKLLDRLMARNVPVDAIGIQGHLKPYREGFNQARRSEEHTSELQSLMRISYAVFCLKKKIQTNTHDITNII